MEQFPLREMIPLMIDDFKPNIWPISNKNLTNNQQILDYLSINIYSKGASSIRIYSRNGNISISCTKYSSRK